MTLRIGVIGTGMIGQDHIRRITQVLNGGEITAVTDQDESVATQVGSGVGATVYPDGKSLIEDPDVDAVIVASWGPTHEEFVLAGIAAGKQVFCEKPLATTQDACLRIIEAEVAAGRRLVQVGFMRRYDAAYRALKQVLDSGRIGAPLMFHSRHRNPSVPGHYTREMAITDTAVHDFDVARWLLGEEFAAARVLVPRSNRHGGELQDPLLIILETAGGAIVDVETSVNVRYGYHIGGEVVGEDGTAELADTSPVLVRHGGQVAGRVPDDWRERFLLAYDAEFQEWLDALGDGGGPTGPTSWDGYAAAVVSDAAVSALYSGSRVSVDLIDQPPLYL